jgi:hypothetical protein
VQNGIIPHSRPFPFPKHPKPGRKRVSKKNATSMKPLKNKRKSYSEKQVEEEET